MPSLIRFKMRRGRIEYKCMKAIEADFGKRNGVKNTTMRTKFAKFARRAVSDHEAQGKITMAAFPCCATCVIGGG